MVKKSFKKVVTETVADILNTMNGKEIPPVSLIIPTYNEEKTLGKVIKEGQKVKEISEIIVVDDGSKDKSAKIAEDLGVSVIKHHKNMGKGEAIKTGIAHAKGKIIAFIDADWKNIESKKIRAIIAPIVADKADFVKASFSRKRGRVTEFAVKPLMKTLYPEEKFKQPISGQFAGRKEFLKKTITGSKWGIDIAILLDALKHDQRIMEVNVGELVHKKSSDENVAEMSKQVMETMLKKSGFFYDKHQIILISDKVIFRKDTITSSSKAFLKMLKKKRGTVALITSKHITPENKELFDIIKTVKRRETQNKILKVAKKIARSNESSLDKMAVIAKTTDYAKLAENVAITFCFKTSSPKLKEHCKIISNIAETLVYLE